MTKTLSIVGCGKVGKVLGRLWTEQNVFTLLDIQNRTLDSAERAVAFIGAGRPIGVDDSLRIADIYLIAASDDEISPCCDRLSQAGLLSSKTVVFHCSGALRSTELEAARHQGCAIASVHPVRSFAQPEQVVSNFTGTYCGAEGDTRAMAILSHAFSAIGGRLVPINADQKILYHAAAVFACNYLTTLLDVARHAYVQSGIPNDVALKLMEPLVRETIDNVFRLGPAKALTGPIARGDMATVEKQQSAIFAWDRDHGKLYEEFAKLTMDLAARRNRS